MGRWYVVRVALVAALSLLIGVAPVVAQEGTPAATPVDGNLAPDEAPPGPPLPANATPVGMGLDNPRGLTIGPDGALYVAEAGSAGDGPCIIGPEGDTECYGFTGAVTRIADGGQERVITGLRSRALEDGSQATGPHDLAFQDGDLYAVVGLGADPSDRVDLDDDGPDLGRVVRIAGGEREIFADIAAFELEENPAGGQLDSNPYSLVALDDGGFLVADAGANALFRVDADGIVSTVTVFPERMVEGPDGQEMPMQSVPDSVAVGPDGDYYVGELTGFPFPPGGANVYRVPASGGEAEVFADGFTNILSITFGPDGSLYVLEFNRGGLFNVDPSDPTTLEGSVIRVAPDGSRSVVASSGLIAPTAVEVAEDGTIYVSMLGILPGAGLVIQLPGDTVEAATPVA